MARITRTTKTVKRAVHGGRLGELVVEIRSGTLVIRPLRARTPLFEATYPEIVYAVLLAREPKRPKAKKRAVRR